MSLMLMATLTYGQSTRSHRKALQQYFDQVKAGEYPTIPREILQDQENAGRLLTEVSSFYQDTTENVRQAAYELTRRISAVSKHANVHQQAVEALTMGLQDSAASVVGSNLSSLTYFQPSAFSSQMRQQLSDLLAQSVAHQDQLIKLIGYLQMKEEMPTLRNILQSTKSQRIQWAAYLALARLGDSITIDKIMNRVRRIPLGDDLIYDVLPDLIYTRQKAAMDYMIEIIFSDEKACESADPETGGAILCGYRVMEQLAPVIQDFPLQLDASGDLAEEDYAVALQQVRDWFGTKGDQYDIVNGTY